jgi:hypothetical protein
MGVRAELKVRGRPVTFADPSGGTFDAAGDFDHLVPAPMETFRSSAESIPLEGH